MAASRDCSRRRARRCDLADHAAEVEAQLGGELAREILHAPVVGETGHVEPVDAAVARDEQRALEQRRADAVALPFGFDGEGDFGFARERGAERAQFGCAAQHAVDKEAVHDRVEAERCCDVVLDEFVGHRAAETAVAAVAVEAQQMIAIDVGFADP